MLLGMIQHKQISVDRAIKMACEQVQNRLTVVQLETQENSGCTLSSLVIDHGIVYAANCGNC